MRDVIVKSGGISLPVVDNQRDYRATEQSFGEFLKRRNADWRANTVNETDGAASAVAHARPPSRAGIDIQSIDVRATDLARFVIEKTAEQKMDIPALLPQNLDQFSDALIVAGTCRIWIRIADNSDFPARLSVREAFRGRHDARSR